jgi:hypothetical protein
VGVGKAPGDAPAASGEGVGILPDERLLAAHDLALAALHEITPAATVGDAAGYTLEDDGVVSLRFANLLAGYPGWFWTVSLARVDDAEPTVLEVELLPGDDALLAPEWVPWAVRLAEYQAQQAILEAERAAAGEDDEASDEDDESDDDGDLDLDDSDDDDSEDDEIHLHAGDLDGVDIDLVADDSDQDDEDSDDGDSDDEDSDDDESDDEDSEDADSDEEDSDDEESEDEDSDEEDSDDADSDRDAITFDEA